MPEVVFRGKDASADWALSVLAEADIEAWVVEPRAEMTPYHSHLRVYQVAVADGAGEKAKRELERVLQLEAPDVRNLTRQIFDAGTRALAAPLAYVLLEITVLRSRAEFVIAGSFVLWVCAFGVLARRMNTSRDP